MKRLKITCLTAIIIIGMFSALHGQTKWAQTGFNFLNVSSDAKASGMGEAVNSLSGYSGALFHNPATMANIPGTVNANFSINQWIADINYMSASVMFSPFSGEYGVLGFSLQSIDYGDVLGTRVASTEKGFEDTGLLNPTALAFGIGYAKMISDRFGIGAQVRFAYQSLGESVIPEGDGTITKENKANAIAYDFGTFFKTGIESLTFGMSVRNFSKEVKFEQEGFQLPLIFTIGLSANVFDFFSVPGPEQALILSFDSTHPRSHPEQVKIGAEYQFMKMFSIRGGLVTANSEDKFSFGMGINSAGLGISALNIEVDYSYTPFGVFDNVQKFTARISL